MNLHHLKVTTGPTAFSAAVELDGKPLLCAKLEIGLDVTQSYATALVTLPVTLELDGPINANFVRSVAVRPALQPEPVEAEPPP